MSTPKFEIKNLNLHYGNFHALKNINMDIEPNKITAFIGPSGCGKSTFLKTLNRMNDLEENVTIDGSVRMDGKDIYKEIRSLLMEYQPDIVIITGHDAYYQKKGSKNDIKNYKNTENFVKAVREARKYEKSHEKLVIITGACQSDYEELIRAGANFASSPKRVNIHALDPAIIATVLAMSERNKEIDLVGLLAKTKYGADGMGGIISNGMMYVGFPR